MTEPQITPELRELIHRHLGTLDEIEVLLALFARRGDRVSVDSVAGSVRKPRDAARGHLDDLATRGFALHHMNDDTYAYPAPSAEIDAAVEELSRMYEQRPVTLIKALYDRPSNAVLSFADAFRVRSD